jgi:hypothetical protein
MSRWILQVPVIVEWAALQEGNQDGHDAPANAQYDNGPASSAKDYRLQTEDILD